jgi:thiol-disulfide isomerase/thioredoxin
MKILTKIPLRTASLGLMLLASMVATAAATQESGTGDPPRQWLDRLPREDRAALETLVGFECPPLPEKAVWVGGAPPEELRGKVVLLQSFSTRGNGRRSVELLARALGETPPQDLVVLLVHTPDNAERAELVLERQPLPYPCLIDADGAACDRLGFFRRPTNLLIDRQGEVRLAGLTAEGAAAAAKKLLAETFDPAKAARTRTAPKANDAIFPSFTNPPGSDRDLRGKAMPEFVVERWITQADEPRGRLLLIDFWATWCRPCIASLPKLRQIAGAYRDDVCVVGLSSEKRDDFESGMRKLNLNADEFNYALAIDPQRRVQQAFGVRGIPYISIASADGIVRWQGHPNALTPETLDSLVAANRLLTASGGGDAMPPPRWRRDRSR